MTQCLEVLVGGGPASSFFLLRAAKVLFFVPMPCALEAQTVIKKFCLWLVIPTCWRIGEKES